MSDKVDNLHLLASIGVLTALPREYASVELMLDEPREWSAPGTGAGRRFLLGRIPNNHGGTHVIAVALLLDMGNNSAAIAANQLLAHFPKVKHLVMCGIAGGVPMAGESEHDVRLGDIVVSNRGGVVQYDLVKENPNGILEHRHPLRPPGAELLEAVRHLLAGEELHRRPWEAFLGRGEHLKNGLRPADNVNAIGEPVQYPIDPARQPGVPRVFHGNIAAANRLLKNALHRDELRNRFGVKAIEMESSGVADAAWTSDRAGYITVRGICDYCDEQKGDAWQSAAAIAAAAYTRVLIASMHSEVAPVRAPLSDSDDYPPEAASVEHAVLNETPGETDHFVGREVELESLIGALTTGQGKTTLCGITGMGGTGKSFLAAEAARRCRFAGKFSDGIIWYDGKDFSPDGAMSLVVRTLATSAVRLVPEPGVGIQGALEATYRKEMCNKQILIVVDGYSGVDGLQALVTESPGSAILITSRYRMPSLRKEMSLFIDLKTMSEHESVSLLRLKGRNSAPCEDQPLREVADLCGRLPLALSIAGALLSDRDIWPNVQSFRTLLEQRRLDCLSIAGEETLGVRATLLLSYEQLGVNDARLFRALAALERHSFDASAIAALLTHNIYDAVVSLSRLVQRSILERTFRGEYVLHDLLRDLANEKLVQTETVEEVQTLRHQANKFWSSWEKAQCLVSLGTARARSGYTCEALELYDAAQRISFEIGDPRGEAAALGGTAAARERLGDSRHAIEHYEACQKLNREIGDRQGEAAALGGLAAAHARLGDLSKAIEQSAAAKQVSREIGDLKGEAAALGGIAAAHAQLGNARKAVEFFEAALKINIQIGDRRGEASTLGGLAAANTRLGNTREAIRHFVTSLKLNREIGDRRGEASTLGGLAAASARSGETRRAIGHFQASLKISREIGDRRGEAASLGGLASIYVRLSDLSKAIKYNEASLTINREIGDRCGEAASLGGLASIHVRLGDLLKAIKYNEASLTISREVGDRRGEAASLGGIAAALSRLGDSRKATEHFEASLMISREIGDRRGEATSLGGLASIHVRLGDLREAIKCFEASLKLHRENANDRGQALALEGLSGIHEGTENHSDAIRCMVDARASWKRAGDTAGVKNSLLALLRLSKKAKNAALVQQYETELYWLDA